MKVKGFILNIVEGFDWDEGNMDKNWGKHKVTNQECEEVFFDPWLIVYYDKGHSIKEDISQRKAVSQICPTLAYHLLGKTLGERKLFVTFTTRDDKIRVISARDMNEKERREYDKYKKKDTSF